MIKMDNKRFYQSLKGTWETKNKKLKRKITSKRWEIAQDSEEDHWKDYSTEKLLMDNEVRYTKKSKILLKDWSKLKKITKNTKILQIGCGPMDVINYFRTGDLSSVDPLAEFYKRRFNFDYKKSNLVQASGENIPFPDKSFDIVILINVLDHTHSPERVLSEVKRVLKEDGIFHFENYIFQKRFLQIAKIWGKFKEIITGQIFNIHHPFMFTVSDLKILISKQYSIVKEEVGRDIGSYEDINELIKELQKAKKLTIRLPVFFGLLGGINYTLICRKK